MSPTRSGCSVRWPPRTATGSLGCCGSCWWRWSATNRRHRAAIPASEAGSPSDRRIGAMELASIPERSGRGGVAGEKAGQIVAAMRASVARRGIAGSTFDHVAREAGVSRGLLHYYFGSKEQLLVEVVRRDGDLRLAVLAERP